MSTRIRKFKRQSKLSKRQKVEVKRLIGNQAEEKRFPFFQTESPSTTGFFTNCLQIPQGLTAQNRVGAEIELKKVQFRFETNGTDTFNNVRVILFRWYQDASVSPPTIFDILDSPSSSWNYLAPLSWLNRHKFHVLLDTMHLLTNAYSFNSSGTVSSSVSDYAGAYALSRRYNFYGKKLGKKKVVFDASTNTGENQLFVLTLSDSNAIPHPTISWLGEVTYTDA